MEGWFRRPVNPMKPWLEMPVAIRWVVLARNVQKLQDWLAIVSGSNAFTHTMTT